MLATTITASLLLAYGYHLGVAATLVVLVGGIPGLYLMWAAYRDDRAEAETTTHRMDPAQLADELAIVVKNQWAAEAALRGLDDPLLSVRWAPADSYTADDWQSLVELVRHGAGWNSQSRGKSWAADVAELAGEGDEISNVLARIPTRRLVVLGEPGAGKTMLLVRLVLDLLRDRNPGEAVPMLVAIGSWDPARQELRKWLVEQITVDYPALGAYAVKNSVGDSWADVLLARGLILPILDGLDELPEAMQAVAITRINRTLQPGEAMVVSSRSRAFVPTVRRRQGRTVRFHGAAVIEICPIDAASARKYLLHDVGDTRRWDRVIADLGTSSPVGQAFSTPLMLSLAREIYNSLPHTRAETPREPAELYQLGIKRKNEVEQHLLRAFIPSAYQRSSGSASQWRRSWAPRDAERWLTFLARHLEYTVSSPSFAWWEMELAVPRVVTSLSILAIAAIGFGLTAAVMAIFASGTAASLGVAFAVGFVAGLSVWGIAAPQKPITGVRWSLRFAFSSWAWRNAVRARSLGPTIVLARVTFPVGLILTWLVFGLSGVPGWLLVGVVALGIYGEYGDLSEIASPHAVLVREQRSLLPLGLIAFMYATVGGFVLGTGCGRCVKAIFGVTDAPTLGAAAGLVFAVTFVLGLGLAATSWSRCRLACAFLALRRRLPWHLMSFLEDAHHRGVLRQAGACYQFRHRELQQCLAFKGSLPYRAYL